MTQKIRSFYDLTADQLAAWLKERREPAFRTKQILGGIYRRCLPDFAAMTDLPAALREALTAQFSLEPVTPLAVSETGDSVKLLLGMPAGGQVECVRLAMDNAYTACVSSQIGCAVDCRFCATGQTPYERSLTVAEIIAQVAALNRLEKPARNVVFMGMGEPFHNYANVVSAIRRLTAPEYLGMSPRRITISTSGVVPGIHKYAEEGLDTELAVSLNASTDAQRRDLMPGVARWTLAQLLEACQHYTATHKGQPVTFAYVLLAGINDDFEDAERLGKLLKDQPHHLNLIPWNEVEGSPFRAPVYPRVQAFMKACLMHHLNVSVRHGKGGDIDAACGQLRTRHQAAEEPAVKTSPGPKAQTSKPGGDIGAARGRVRTEEQPAEEAQAPTRPTPAGWSAKPGRTATAAPAARETRPPAVEEPPKKMRGPAPKGKRAKRDAGPDAAAGKGRSRPPAAEEPQRTTRGSAPKTRGTRPPSGPDAAAGKPRTRPPAAEEPPRTTRGSAPKARGARPASGPDAAPGKVRTRPPAMAEPRKKTGPSPKARGPKRS